jgi:hypothetical protein
MLPTLRTKHSLSFFFSSFLLETGDQEMMQMLLIVFPFQSDPGPVQQLTMHFACMSK